MDQLESMISDLRISRSTTAEHVAAALRARIIGGDLPPGLPLREVPIAASIGVSRNTVREAFRLLSAEGLVHHNMHRGITVAKLSETDISDIYQARRSIELAALANVTNSDLAAIEAAVEALEQAIRADDSKKVIDADFAFHTAIARAIASQRLMEFYESLLTELRLAMTIADHREDHDRAFASDHISIVRALKKRDVGTASRILEAHLKTSEEIALSVTREPMKPVAGR